MSNAAIQFDTQILTHRPRRSGRALIGFGLAMAAIAPLAVVAFGLLRGGVEPYIVLAALVLG